MTQVARGSDAAEGRATSESAADRIAAFSARFEKRRLWRVRFVRLGLALFCGALLVAVFALFGRAVDLIAPYALRFGFGSAVDVARGFDLQGAILGLLKIAKNPPAEAWLKDWFEAFPWTVTFLIGAGFGLWKGGVLSIWLHGLAFERFDERVLTRIRAPQAYDPLRGTVRDAKAAQSDIALPFVGQARKASREKLAAFARAGLERGHWFPFATRPWAVGLHQLARAIERRFPLGRLETPFAYMLVLGRSGAGKSRLAIEAARRLGLRGDYGGYGGANRPDGPDFGSWWRVQARGLPCGGRDPWDAGWLRPGLHKRESAGFSYKGWHDELAVDAAGAWFAQLASWRPARPTVLILDDPRDADALEIVKTLHQAAAHYRHPVRLIIVNQTLPKALDNALKPEEPLRLDHDDRLDEQDVLELLRHAQIDKRITLGQRGRKAEIAAALHDLTHGEPLLVEIAINFVIAGEAPEKLTRDRLVTERVARVIRALETAGLSEGHMVQLAVATLLSGGDVTSKASVRRILKLPSGAPISPDTLQHAFPDEQADLTNVIPPIRPEPIGDAFAERIFAKLDDEEAQENINACWREASAPGNQGMADALTKVALRLAGEPPRTNKLANALAQAPAPDIPLDRKALALAFADKALILPAHAFPEQPAGIRALRLHDPACAHIAAASPAEALQLVEALFTMAEAQKGETRRPFMAQGWLALLAVALNRVGDSAEAQAVVKEKIESWLDRLREVWPRILGTIPVPSNALTVQLGVALGLALGEAARDWAFAARLKRFWLDCEAGSANFEVRNLLDTALVDAPAPILSPAADPRVYDQMADAAAIAVATVARCRYFVAPFLKATETAAIKPCMALPAARAIAALTTAEFASAEACRAAVVQVEAIVKSFPERQDLLLPRARAWRSLTFALREDEHACREAFKKVEAIATPFPLDRDLQNERAVAWIDIATSLPNDQRTRRAAVETIEAIAEQFPQDLDMQRHRASAQALLAFCFIDDQHACRTAVETIEAIAELLPDDRDVQWNRALAWDYLHHSLLDVQQTGREAVKTADAIASPFPQNHDLQLGRARAWRKVAFISRHDGSVFETAIGRIEEITAFWPESMLAKKELTEARSYRQHSAAGAVPGRPPTIVPASLRGGLVVGGALQTQPSLTVGFGKKPARDV